MRFLTTRPEKPGITSRVWSGGISEVAKPFVVHLMLILGVFLGADLFVNNGVNTRAMLADVPTDRVLYHAGQEVLFIRNAIHRGIFHIKADVVRQGKDTPSGG
jgi:hypothetical protein